MATPGIVDLIHAERLKALADEMTLRRGAAYAREQRVSVVDHSADLIRAIVRGNEAYMVELFERGAELHGRCSCPASQARAFCKHCVAVALTLGAGGELDLRVATPAPESGPAFSTDQEVKAFLAEHRITHAWSLCADVLLPYLPQKERVAMRYVLGRQPLGDVASVERVRRYAFALAHAPRMRELLPAAAHAFLRNEAEGAARGRADTDRLTPPQDPERRELFARVLRLREEIPEDVAPRPREALSVEKLRFVDELPGFGWADERRALGPDSYVPSDVLVELVLEGDQAEVECIVCGTRCTHVLAAIDTLLLWLSQPLDTQGRAVLEELRRPAWERALRALDEAVAEESRAGEFIAWRLSRHSDDELSLTAYLHRLTKKGVPSTGNKVGPTALLERHRALLSPQDERIAWLLERDGERPQQVLLLALVGHPRVVLAENPNARVTVEAAKIGLLADHRGESVVLVPALDGTPLPEGVLDRARRAREGTPLFFFDEGGRKLTVLELPDEVLRALDALGKYGNSFPPESHAALVEKLSGLSARVPVAMPRTVLGEAVTARCEPVLRLELQPDGGVRVELRVRPLPESATFPPGEGVRDVVVRRDGKPLHAKRIPADELATARTLWTRLPLPARSPGDDAFVSLLPTPQEALAFLDALKSLESPPALEWLGTQLELVGRAQATALKVSLEKKRDWFGVTGGLSMEGERVTLAVLLDAARRKVRYVEVGAGRYVEIAESLERHLQRLSDYTYQGSHGIEVGPAAHDVLRALGDEGAEVDADKTWRALAERIFAAKSHRPKIPSGLKAELRPYQEEGFAWMSRLASWGAGAVLADDMGLGKTVQALALLLDRAKKGPALVVAPTSVGFNWVDEARRFAPSLKLHVLAESPDRGATLFALKARDVLVVSYGLLARDATRLSQVHFATVILDEAQALKNAGTQRARAARGLEGDFKLALSGTPLENHLGELWSLFRIVFPGLLGSWDAFRDRYATPIEKRLDPTAAPALSRVLAPFLLRRTKEQVATELPSRTDQRVPVVLSPEEWQLYEDARLAALSELETPKSKLKDQERRVQVLAALTRLRLLASHPRLYDPRSKAKSAKLTRLLELVDELLDEGHRALVFSQFTSHLALVREALDAKGIRYLYLDGATPRRDREARVRAFQDGAAPLFLISLKAGGFGLNLTEADNVIHLDPWWNPAVEDQASDRAHRIGQTRPVTVYRLVAKGTIEEQILSLHEEKRELVTGVLEGKDQAARLSTRELLALLSAPAARLLDDAEPATTTRH